MAEAHSYSPREVDALNVRDLGVMLHGAVRKTRSKWQVGAMIAAKVHNMGGPRGKSFDPKPPADLYPDLFHGETSDEKWEKEMEEKFSQYNPD
jgi:hypothetical protein